MNHYRFTESQDTKGNPIGTLEKQVTEGGQTSWQEDMKGYIPYDKEAEKDKEHDIAIADINSKIPEEASEENKLATDDDVATNSAIFRGTYNLVSDLSLTTSATREQVAAALGTAISEADNNDFCYVEVPTDDATPTEIARTDRYKFNGETWGFEFGINGFTAAQWASINSGITSALVTIFSNKAEVGTSQDTPSENTIYGAKAYAASLSIISVVALTSDVTSECSITGASNSGRQQTIVYTNSSGSDKTVTVPATNYSTPDGQDIELTCPDGGYCEVSYLNVEGVIFARGV